MDSYFLDLRLLHSLLLLGCITTSYWFLYFFAVWSILQYDLTILVSPFRLWKQAHAQQWESTDSCSTAQMIWYLLYIFHLRSRPQIITQNSPIFKNNRHKVALQFFPFGIIILNSICNCKIPQTKIDIYSQNVVICNHTYDYNNTNIYTIIRHTNVGYFKHC